MNQVTCQDIEAALQALRPTHLSVTDDGHLHIGHEGAKSGGHFSVDIISPDFQGLASLERHRLIYQTLEPLMQKGIHALKIKAHPPASSTTTLSNSAA